MRHIQVTHTYVIEISSGLAEQSDVDEVVMRGIEVMENFIKNRSANAQELRSDWVWMPKEYSRARGKIHSIAPQEAKVTHPWDQGLWIFPPDHPLHETEAKYRQAYTESDDPAVTRGLKLGMKEIEAGYEEAGEVIEEGEYRDVESPD